MTKLSAKKIILQQLVSIAIAIGLFAAAFGPGLPYVRLSPGTAYDATGSADGTEIISVENTKDFPTYKVNGHMLMLTVTEWGAPYGHLAWTDALRSVWDRAIVVHPSSFFYPDGADYEADVQQGYDDIHLAEQQAIGAVFHYMNKPIKSVLRVDDFAEDFPAVKHLKLGDVVISVDGKKVTTYLEFEAATKDVKAGQSTTWVVKRQGKEVTTAFAPIDDGYEGVAFGVKIQEVYSPPMKLKWNLASVGGPSGGLAFALALYEKFSKEDLLRGRTIAVTGTISEEDGFVDAIGGIDQKLALAARSGAKLMLIPGMNCSDIDAPIPPELTVVPVYHLDEAIDMLRKPDGYKKFPTCEDEANSVGW
ncbi:MAG: hypothetical protein RL410_1564 [Actinomycetota bacterium]|jgi:PDZ domain-containing protein